MILVIFSLFLTLFSGISFISTTTYSILDNTMISLNYSLPQEWIELEPIGSDKPLYDTNKVEQTTLNHFKTNLKGKIDTIKVGFYYFDCDSLKELSTRYVSGVRISLKADITSLKKYSRAMTYVIKKTE